MNHFSPPRPGANTMAGAAPAETLLRVEYSGGTRAKEVPLCPLEDSSPLLACGDWPALRQRLGTDGYVFLRGVASRADVGERG